MEIRVKKAKLAMVHHLHNLEGTTLAKQVYTEKTNQGWPGLVSECQDIITEWKLPNLIKGEIQISAIKSEAAIQNEIILSKLEIMKDEKYEQKAYLHEMSVHDSRMNFSLRSRMFDCKITYFNNPKFKAELWKCDSCETYIDSQSHIL